MHTHIQTNRHDRNYYICGWFKYPSKARLKLAKLTYGTKAEGQLSIEISRSADYSD